MVGLPYLKGVSGAGKTEGVRNRIQKVIISALTRISFPRSVAFTLRDSLSLLLVPMPLWLFSFWTVLRMGGIREWEFKVIIPRKLTLGFLVSVSGLGSHYLMTLQLVRLEHHF